VPDERRAEDDELWGREHLVGDDAPPALKERIARAIATLATTRWLGLSPVARHRRWAVVARGASAREVYGSLLDRYGSSRPPTDPFLVAAVLRTPDRAASARHDRASTHAEIRDLRPGARIGLRLEDWFYLPATSPAGPDLLQPHFVTVPATTQDAEAWLVEVGQVFIIDDGLTLRPDAIDIRAREIRAVGRLEPWAGVPESEEPSPPRELRLHEVGVAGRIAPNEHFSVGAPVRLESPRYYRCPRCAGRTRIDPSRLVHDADFRTAPSVFPPDLEARFDAVRAVPAPEFTFDLYCQRCRSPIRLVYHFAEPGMGGPWHAVITSIIEALGALETKA
jgi:hypothetical protein